MGTLHLDRSGRCVLRAPEDEEEGVALRVHLHTVPHREGVADDAPVPGENAAVPVAEPLEELGRVLDVREDEGDGSRGSSATRRSYASRALAEQRLSEHLRDGHAPSLQFEITVQVVSLVGSWSDRNDTPAS